MWDAISRPLAVVLATILTGVAIKVMDDFVDQEIDLVQGRGRTNLASVVGGGVAAYAMLAMLIAVVLNAQVTISLFCAAYAIGMGQSLTFVYPSRIRGWGEAAIALVLSLVATGILTTISAVLLMLAVQIQDNVTDNEPGNWPLNVIFNTQVGKTPAVVCAVALLGIATSLSPLVSLAVLVSYVMFFAFERWYKTCI